jgi:hypothetical protein
LQQTVTTTSILDTQAKNKAKETTRVIINRASKEKKNTTVLQEDTIDLNNISTLNEHIKVLKRE